MKRTRGDVIFDTVNYILVSVFFLLILYPLYFILIASISNPDYVNTGAITFWPRGITLEGYQRTLREVERVARLPEHDPVHGAGHHHQRVPHDDGRLRPLPQGAGWAGR